MSDTGRKAQNNITYSPVSVSTTGATAKTLARFKLPAEGVLSIRAKVKAHRTSGGHAYFQDDRRAVVTVNASTPTLALDEGLGSAVNASGWGGVSFSVSGGYLVVQVTGASSTAITWAGEFDIL